MSSRSSRRTRRCYLRVEPMEDRLAPSSITPSVVGPGVLRGPCRAALEQPEQARAEERSPVFEDLVCIA